MDEQLKKQIEEFREKTEKFSKGEINVAEYKSVSYTHLTLPTN